MINFKAEMMDHDYAGFTDWHRSFQFSEYLSDLCYQRSI